MGFWGINYSYEETYKFLVEYIDTVKEETSR